ncbi:MAG: hypothetical protein HYZ37_17035 [Candidatus Solibacter usitatus]|nr:hypothetical protein [Candidatus Solibacter usitatus]
MALTTAGALAAALVIVFALVLPAEYGRDPLGTGRLLGIAALSAPPVQAVETPRDATLYKPSQLGPIGYHAGAYKVDSAQFTLGPYEYVEYKYRLEQGAAMLYSWSASAPVKHDFHGEPDGKPAGTAESFDKNDRRDGHGTFTAPFSGIHGWYWENTGGESVTVAISSAGYYSDAIEIGMNHARRRHVLTPLATVRSAQ